MVDERVRDLISRTIEGMETLVHAESGEIFLDVPADNPQYIHVEEGETIQEGDVRSEVEPQLDSPALRRWTVERIGRETVVGTDQETGERTEWDRESIEKKLAIGEFSTQLSAFGRVNVTVGTETPTHDGPSDEESVTVVVYGDDGQQFTQTYRLGDAGGGDGGDRPVELVEPEPRVKQFDPELRERFDRTVEAALREEGYAV